MAFDDFDITFDDEEEEDALVEEEGPNRTFLIAAIALAAVFLIGLCIVVALIFMPQLTGRGTAEISPNEQTNNFNMTLAAETATAALLTLQAGPAEVEAATETPIPPPPEATATQPSELLATPTGEGGAEVAEVTPGEGTVEPGDETPTQDEAATSFLEDGEPTPTRVQIVIGDEDTDDELGLGGPADVETALPDTGFSTEVGLVGAGLLALALVVVVVVARRIRLP